MRTARTAFMVIVVIKALYRPSKTYLLTYSNFLQGYLSPTDMTNMTKKGQA
jgi:hypothetical protein